MNPPNPAPSPRARGRIHGLAAALALLTACGPAGLPEDTAISFAGATMGTRWSAVVTVPKGEVPDDVHALIQADLDAVEAVFSTWREDSEISVLNRAPAGTPVPASPRFLHVLGLCDELVRTTGGAFDPTVGPLVRLWGFGSYDDAPEAPAPAALGAAIDAVDWGAIRPVDGESMERRRDDVQLDLSAVAKGYGVDVVASTLDELGYGAYLLEVGGEMVLRGTNPDGDPWRVGIDDPRPPPGSDPLSPIQFAPRPPFMRLGIEDQAVATSGDYRNVRKVGGRLVSHAIDPRSGAPIDHDLASATVVVAATEEPLAAPCAKADALATACLVLGPEAALAMIELVEGAECLLLVRDPEADGGLRIVQSTGLPPLVLGPPQPLPGSPPGSK